MALFKRKTTLTGQTGEDIAANFLKKEGFLIIQKNYTNPKGKRLGEIDVIAKDRAEIVFVEVKTRIISENHSLLPEENITPTKLHKLNKIASFYVSQNKLWNSPYRFDAISILLKKDGEIAQIKHFRHIFI